MKTNSTRSKTTRKPQRPTALGSYLAITAGAGAASLLSANAAIIPYSGTPVTMSYTGTDIYLYWGPDAARTGTAVNTSGVRVTDYFNILYRSDNYVYSSKDESSLKLYFGVGTGTGALGYPSLLKLTSGDTIDQNINWFGDTYAMMNNDYTTAESPWATGQDGTQGIIPFYFSTGSSSYADKYYGWADFTYNNDALTRSLTLNNFAYNNTPNEAITTGAIPEPSTLLLLALGGAGLAAARLRRKAKQTTGTAA